MESFVVFLDHVDHRAPGRMPARAAVDRGGQELIELSEIRHFAPDRFQVARSNLPDFIAACAGRPAKLQDASYFGWRETELPGAADERELPEMVFSVDAVATAGARRGGDEPDFFEVSDGFDVDPGPPGKFADCDSGHKNLLIL